LWKCCRDHTSLFFGVVQRLITRRRSCPCPPKKFSSWIRRKQGERETVSPTSSDCTYCSVIGSSSAVGTASRKLS
jgi:hypothetical protein